MAVPRRTSGALPPGPTKAFYGQIAYERLSRPSAPPHAGTAPMASNSRWIYDGAYGRDRLAEHLRAVSAVH